MLNEFHYQYGNFLTSGMHLMLLLFAARANSYGGWIVCLGLIGAISVFAWSGNYRRARAVSDTPTCKVASAPQGYVELYGKAKLNPGYSTVSPASGRPCVWFRYRVEEKVGGKWQRVDGAMSSDTFQLDDGTGQVLIDPDGAEIYTKDRRTWSDGAVRYQEWLLTPGDNLYALGELSTEGGGVTEPDLLNDFNTLLAQWKADKPALLKRFDLNGDGQIDLKEWELARRAALREVRKAQQETMSLPGINVLRKPRDGRLYMLSDLGPQQLARRYAFWSVIQLVVALSSGAGFLFVFTRLALR